MKKVIKAVLWTLIYMIAFIIIDLQAYERGLSKGKEVGFNNGANEALDTLNQIVLKQSIKDTTTCIQLKIVPYKDTFSYILSAKRLKK